MATTSSLSLAASRRKQQKPQRLPGEEDNDSEGSDSPRDIAMDEVEDATVDARVSSSGVSPIDLSTTRKEKLILEDKSNLFQSLAAIASPQLLSLCAQLANQQKEGKLSADELLGQLPFPFLSSASPLLPPPPPPADGHITTSSVLPHDILNSAPTTSTSSSAGNKEDHRHPCPSSDCEQVFPNHATRLWHIFVAHEGEDLVYCNTCGAIYKDWDELHSHKCSKQQAMLSDDDNLTITVPLCQRSASADLLNNSGISSTNMPMEVGGSAPCSPATFGVKLDGVTMKDEEMMEVQDGKTEDPNGMQAPFNLFGSLFPMKQNHPMGSMELPAGSPIHPFFPLAMPPFANQHPGGGPPLPFMMRSPFDQRPDFFPPQRQENEDDWEALMEISTSNEAEKIRALVGDKAQPPTDPNQCILCRRVLSCKSALQMHYRTHTGERPFKCRICQRAFTTKGNLKTHMGVHRAKPAFRGVPMGIGPHPGIPSSMGPGPIPGLPGGIPAGLQPTQQCPICQKRFVTQTQLQGHIAEHTQALTRNAPGASIGATPNGATASTPNSTDEIRSPLFSTASTTSALNSPLKTPLSSANPFSAGVVGAFPLFPFLSSPTLPFPPLNSSSAPNSAMIQPPMSAPFDASASIGSPAFNLAQLLGRQITEEIKVKLSPEAESEKSKESEKKETGKGFSSITHTLHLEAPPLRKDAASISPSISSDASSSSGQETQHDHTDSSSVSVGRSESDSDDKKRTSDVESRVAPIELTQRAMVQTAPILSSLMTDLKKEISKESASSNNNNNIPSSNANGLTKTKSEDEKPIQPPENSSSLAENPLLAMQKMWAETEPPPPRQMPVLSKHQCGVCFKHFSSSSALQIHMRTHTGDKPFKCEVCGRAFTTRGNLKVHMGTHSWQQSPSRRGRRIFDAGVASEGGGSPIKSPLGLPVSGPNPLVGLPGMPPLFSPAAAAGLPNMPNMEMLMMMWRTVCSVCQKVCASPAELEGHLKEHLSSVAMQAGAATPEPNSPTELTQSSE